MEAALLVAADPRAAGPIYILTDGLDYSTCELYRPVPARPGLVAPLVRAASGRGPVLACPRADGKPVRDPRLRLTACPHSSVGESGGTLVRSYVL